jgi:hypothetical protein
MALTMLEKRHVGKEVALRSLHARKKEKGIMLQEFCATTGYTPPYAAFLLRTYAKRVILGTVTLVPTRPSPLPRERKHRSENKTRKPVATHPGGFLPGTPGCLSRLRGDGPREP